MGCSRGNIARAVRISDLLSRRRWFRKILALLASSVCAVALAVPQAKPTPQSKPSASADSEYQKGLKLLKAGDIAGARRVFERTVKLAPASAEAHNSLGWVLFSQGETDKAIDELRTAVRLKPRFLEARINLANTLAHANKLEGAQAQASEAVRLDDSSA